MIKKIIFSAFGVAVLLAAPMLAPVLAPALAQTDAAPATTPAERGGLPAITVSAVEKRVLRDRVIASGLIHAVELVQVQPLIEGQPIEALNADIGDRVTKGQVLARLSQSTLELQRSQFVASLAAARATVAQAEAQLIEARSSADEAARVSDRTTKLRQQGSASQAAADTALANAISATARVSVAVQSLEAARAQVTLAEAQLANIDLSLQRTDVVAPVAGEILSRNAQRGAIASAAGPAMFVLIRDNALELRADVAEIDILRLQPGQTVRINTISAPLPLPGSLRLVEPGIDTQTRMGAVRISIDAPENVRTGMFAEAEILIAEHETLAVPLTAVGSSNDGTSVMRVRDGLVERVTVNTGIRDAGFVEVTSGLAEGDLIVTKSAAFVRDGDRITPVLAASGTN